MATVTDIGTLIEQTPGICGGRACIAGTGVSVLRVAGWYRLGRSPEEIVDQYGHLTLAQVYAALAFYHANRDDIDAEIAAEDAEYERLAAAHHAAPEHRLISLVAAKTAEEMRDRLEFLSNWG